MGERLEIIWEYHERPDRHIELRACEMVAARLAEGDPELLQAAFDSVLNEIVETKSRAERTELVAALLLAVSGIASQAIQACSELSGVLPFDLMRALVPRDDEERR